MLEEVAVDYDLRYVDVMAGAHKTPAMLARPDAGE